MRQTFIFNCLLLVGALLHALPPPTSAACGEYIFVTQRTFNGVFDGLGVPRADFACQEEAARSGNAALRALAHDYVAVLSTSSLDARDRIGAFARGELCNARDEVVAATRDALVVNGSAAAAPATADGSNATFAAVTTGSLAGGVAATQTCLDWTWSGSAQQRSYATNEPTNDSFWSIGTNDGCNNYRPIYCISASAVEACAESEYGIVYTTVETYLPTQIFNITYAEKRCRDAAAAASGGPLPLMHDVGIVRAILSTRTSDAKDVVDVEVFADLEGKLVEKTVAEFFGGYLLNRVNFAADGSYFTANGGYAWTFTKAGGTRAGFDCYGMTSADAALLGRTLEADRLNGAQGITRACSNAHALACVASFKCAGTASAAPTASPTPAAAAPPPPSCNGAYIFTTAKWMAGQMGSTQAGVGEQDWLCKREAALSTNPAIRARSHQFVAALCTETSAFGPRIAPFSGDLCNANDERVAASREHFLNGSTEGAVIQCDGVTTVSQLVRTGCGPRATLRSLQNCESYSHSGAAKYSAYGRAGPELADMLWHWGDNFACNHYAPIYCTNVVENTTLCDSSSAVVFATLAKYTPPQIGGVAGADAKCLADAQASSDELLSWMMSAPSMARVSAVISSAHVDAIDHVGPFDSLYRTGDGARVSYDRTYYFNNHVMEIPEYDANGTLLPDTYPHAWMFTKTWGGRHSSYDCMDMTDDTLMVGSTMDIDKYLTPFGYLKTCLESHYLQCVAWWSCDALHAAAPSAAPTPAPVAAPAPQCHGAYIFLSEQLVQGSLWSGAQGRYEADLMCQLEAAEKVNHTDVQLRSHEFIALLSSETAAIADRIGTWPGDLCNLRDERVVATKTDLLAANVTVEHRILQPNLDDFVCSLVHTGSSSQGGIVSGENCLSWTHAGTAKYQAFGRSDGGRGGAEFWYSGTASCNYYTRVYCANIAARSEPVCDSGNAMVFLTVETYQPNDIGDSFDADIKCDDAAVAATDPLLSWFTSTPRSITKAVISADYENAIEHLSDFANVSGIRRPVDNVRIANNLADFLDGNHPSRVYYNSQGAYSSPVAAWVFTEEGGDVSPYDCLGWTSNNSLLLGKAFKSDQKLTNLETVDCSNKLPLLCMAAWARCPPNETTTAPTISPTPPPPPPATCNTHMFYTKKLVLGEMFKSGRSFEMADFICRTEAAQSTNAAIRSGAASFIAAISAPAASAAERIGEFSDALCNVADERVAASRAELLASQLENPVLRVDGFSAVSKHVWTGSEKNGTLDANAHCNDWVAYGCGYNGAFGRSDGEDGSLWQDSPGASCCGVWSPLYCINALNYSYFGSGCVNNHHYIAWVTTNTTNGDIGGIPGADEFCLQDALAYGNSLVRTYATSYFNDVRAYLSDATTNVVTRISTAGSPVIMRSDGYFVMTGALANFFGTGSLIEEVQFDASGSYPGDLVVWTGTIPSPVGSVAPTHCGNWTSKSTSETGQAGDSGAYLSDWMQRSTPLCSTQQHLICVGVTDCLLPTPPPPTAAPQFPTGTPTSAPTASPAQFACGNGAVDAGEDCDVAGGGAPCCGSDCKWMVGALCRAKNASYACDEDDLCVEGRTDCPERVKGVNVVCRAAVDVCDQQEKCNGVNKTCPADEVKAKGYVCRGAGIKKCDITERCDGNSTACPPDKIYDEIHACRPVTNSKHVCDVPEYCPGNGTGLSFEEQKICPEDARRGTDYICREKDVEKVCDVAEYCEGTGGSKFCPSDGYASFDTLCDDGNDCTGYYEYNTSDACQPEGFCGGAWRCECRVTADCYVGVTDPCAVYTCIDTDCIATPAGSDVECRPAVGGCDLPEFCEADSLRCPRDAWLPAGAVCRSPLGECDIVDRCNGLSPDCPDDLWRGAGVTCFEAAAGYVCDAAEVCDGGDNECPRDVDTVQPAGTLCRAAADAANGCDVEEYCDGVTAACPADAAAPNGATCSDGLDCTVLDTCRNKRCIGILDCDCGTDEECTDGNPCSDEFCDLANGGVCKSVANVALLNSTCDDLDKCTTEDRCVADGSCVGTASVAGGAGGCPKYCAEPYGVCCGDQCVCLQPSKWAGHICTAYVDAGGEHYDWCAGDKAESYGITNPAQCVVLVLPEAEGIQLGGAEGGISAVSRLNAGRGVIVGAAAEAGRLVRTSAGAGIDGKALNAYDHRWAVDTGAVGKAAESFALFFAYDVTIYGVRLRNMQETSVEEYEIELFIGGAFAAVDKSSGDVVQVKLYATASEVATSNSTANNSTKRGLEEELDDDLEALEVDGAKFDTSRMSKVGVSATLELFSVKGAVLDLRAELPRARAIVVRHVGGGGKGGATLVELAFAMPDATLLVEPPSEVVGDEGGGGPLSTTEIIAIAVGASVFVCCIVVMALFFVLRTRRMKKRLSIAPGSSSSETSLEEDETQLTIVEPLETAGPAADISTLPHAQRADSTTTYVTPASDAERAASGSGAYVTPLSDNEVALREMSGASSTTSYVIPPVNPARGGGDKGAVKAAAEYKVPDGVESRAAAETEGYVDVERVEGGLIGLLPPGESKADSKSTHAYKLAPPHYDPATDVKGGNASSTTTTSDYKVPPKVDASSHTLGTLDASYVDVERVEGGYIELNAGSSGGKAPSQGQSSGETLYNPMPKAGGDGGDGKDAKQQFVYTYNAVDSVNSNAVPSTTGAEMAEPAEYKALSPTAAAPTTSTTTTYETLELSKREDAVSTAAGTEYKMLAPAAQQSVGEGSGAGGNNEYEPLASTAAAAPALPPASASVDAAPAGAAAVPPLPLLETVAGLSLEPPNTAAEGGNGGGGGGGDVKLPRSPRGAKSPAARSPRTRNK